MPFCTKQARVHPQDGFWSWIVCVSATLNQACIVGFGLSIGVVLPALMSDFQTSREKIAWVGSIAMSLTSLLGSVSGPLSDRFGCRLVTISGALICSLSLLSSSFVNHLELLYLTYGLLFGIGSNFVYTSGILVISEYFSKWRSMALSLVMAGIFLGVLVLGPCLQLMLGSFGWRRTFRVMAGVVSLVVVLGSTYVPNRKDNTKEKYSSSENNSMSNWDSNSNNTSNDLLSNNSEKDVLPQYITEKGQLEGKKKKKFIDFAVWRNPLYVVITLSSSFAFISQYIPKVHMPGYAKDLRVPEDAAADLFIYLGIASINALLVAGALMSTKWVKELHLYQASLFGNGLATVLLPLIKSYDGLIGYIVVYGACDGIFILLLSVLVLNNVDEEMRAGALGMQQFLNSISLLVGLPFAGWIADVYGSYSPAFFMGGGISIAAGLSVFFLHCFRGQTRNDLQETAANADDESENVKLNREEEGLGEPEFDVDGLPPYIKERSSSAGSIPELRKRAGS